MADLRTRLLDLATRIATEFKTIRTEKQNTLVSATNIKTVNSQSLLGAGNITIAGSGGDIKADGTVPFTADQSMGGFKLTNVGNATNSLDAVSLGTLNNRMAIVDYVDSTLNRTAATLVPGFVVDGGTLAAGQLVLCSNNSSGGEGLYQVKPSGPAQIVAIPSIVYVNLGTTYANKLFAYNSQASTEFYSIIPNAFSAMTAKATPVDGDTIGLYDSVNNFFVKKFTILNLKTYLNGFFEQITNKNASSGYAGLSATFQLQLKNIANTFTSLLQNSNTAARTYTLQNRNGTIADDTDIVGAKDRTNHTGTQLAATISDFNTAALAAVSTGAPALLDTLDELAAALGDDPNFATTMTTALGNRVRYDAAQSLTAPQKTQACTNIGIGEPDTDFVATFNTGLL
jgi:hypothetical protein